MGSNGNMSVPTEHKNDLFKRRPITKPPFTLSDLKKAIPPHCFHRSLIRSFSYVVRDLVLVSIFYYVATTYFHRLPSSYRYLAWPIYWIAQGCIFAALWVIGHECGHRAFSDYQWVDDVVGFIIHSSVLTPYFSWKYSHRRHHSNTGSLDHDEAHVPRRKSKLKWYAKYLNNPVGRALSLAYTLSLGWPSYLTFNAFGRSDDSFASHYDPYSVLYNDRERLQIIVSDVGIITTFYVLYRIALVKGVAWLVCIYGVPLLICNSLIMIVSYLNHTHPSLPRYDSSEWDWLRGALTTADRDIGIFNKVFHNGSNTHVIHHLFTFMPQYHAVEATEAIKPILGDYYQCDDTFVFKALWRDANSCIYVEKDEGYEDRGVYWFNKKL